MYIKEIVVGNTTYTPKTHKLPPLSDLLAHILMFIPGSVEMKAAKIWIRNIMCIMYGNSDHFFPLHFVLNGQRALAWVKSTKSDAWRGRQYENTNACALAFNKTFGEYLKEKLLWQPTTYPIGASTLGNKHARRKNKKRPMFIRQ